METRKEKKGLENKTKAVMPYAPRGMTLSIASEDVEKRKLQGIKAMLH